VECTIERHERFQATARKDEKRKLPHMNQFDAKGTFDIVEKEIESRLQPKGYTRTKHQHHPGTFGNIYSVYECGRGLIRFIWDGKDRRYVIRVYRKRSWFMSTFLISVLGRNDPDQLLKEFVLTGDDATNDDMLKQTYGELLALS